MRSFSGLNLVGHDSRFRCLPLLQCRNCPALRREQDSYRVPCGASLDLFRDFLSVIERQDIKITSDNFSILSELSTEFGFDSLLTKRKGFSKNGEFA
jgi:hypothetical protein